MKKTAIALAALVVCLLFGGVGQPGSAQQGSSAVSQPRFLNARVEERSAGGGLAAAFGAAVRAQRAQGWIAYTVAATPGDHGLCDADRPQRIYLEGRPARTSVEDRSASAADLLLLFRVDGGKVQKLRVASIKCEVDAGGLPLAWLGGAGGGESVALLHDLLSRSDPSVREEPALMAIALHADPAAGRALEEFVAPGRPASLRKRAVFWLGVGRGDVDALLRLARSDESLDIRKTAMFWLSRSEDPRAVAFTEEVLRK